MLNHLTILFFSLLGDSWINSIKISVQIVYEKIFNVRETPFVLQRRFNDFFCQERIEEQSLVTILSGNLLKSDYNTQKLFNDIQLHLFQLLVQHSSLNLSSLLKVFVPTSMLSNGSLRFSSWRNRIEMIFYVACKWGKKLNQ